MKKWKQISQLRQCINIKWYNHKISHRFEFLLIYLQKENLISKNYSVLVV